MDRARKLRDRFKWSETLAYESQEAYEGQGALANVHARMAMNAAAREGKRARAALLQGDRARARMHSDAQHDAMKEANTHRQEARNARLGATAMRKITSGANSDHKVQILSERIKEQAQEHGNGQNSLADIMGAQASEARNSARAQARAQRAMRNAERFGDEDEEGLSEREAVYVSTLRAVGDEEEAQRIEAEAARRSMGWEADNSEEEDEEEPEELEWSHRDASRASMLSTLRASGGEKEAGAEE